MVKYVQVKITCGKICIGKKSKQSHMKDFNNQIEKYVQIKKPNDYICMGKNSKC